MECIQPPSRSVSVMGIGWVTTSQAKFRTAYDTTARVRLG